MNEKTTPTLVVSSWELRAAKQLAAAAKARGWRASLFDEACKQQTGGTLAIYSGTDRAAEISRVMNVRLVEPALNLLSRIPMSLRLRSVEIQSAGTLNLSRPMFVKPADPLRRLFDAGIYGSLHELRLREPLPDDFPLLVAEPVDFAAEYRLFLYGTRVAASSPYMMSGRPTWQSHGMGGEKAALNPGVESFAKKVVETCREMLPSVCVMDVGLIENRGWAVVEFNPVWCSGILGADPAKVLDLLLLATKNRA